MSAKVWFRNAIGITLFVIAALAIYIIVVDPFFHYHKPIEGLAYELDNDRYQNYGIGRHFDYDTVIVGTSMTANFKTSQCDAVFGGKSVKTAFLGASFKEINDYLERILEEKPEVCRVIRCLDEGNLTQDKDYVSYEGLPGYLYDKNIWNDTEYIFNKNVLIKADEVILRTLEGKPMTSFDEYMNWQQEYVYGKEAVLATFERPERTEYRERLTEEERERVLGNIRQNVTAIAREHPDITFYYFFSPYSVCYWDVDVERQGKMKWYMDLQKTVIEEILTCDNIKLFSFDDNTELTCDLENYKDRAHYSETVNSWILTWMKEGKGRLTWDNYQDYLAYIYNFYGAYDYDSIYT